MVHEAADTAVQQVDLVQQDGFQRLGHDRRPPFMRAVMGDDQVDELMQFSFGEFKFGRRLLDDHDAADNVAHQPAVFGARKTLFQRVFVRLPQIVQQRAAQQQVDVDMFVVSGQIPGDGSHTDGVFKQAADISMVHGAGRRSQRVGLRHRSFEKYVPGQTLPGFGQGLDVAAKLGQHLVLRPLAHGQKVAHVQAVGSLQIADADLQSVLVVADAAGHPYGQAGSGPGVDGQR